MLGRVWTKIRPAIFFDYGRGSWQYDIIVVLILAFIFLSPRTMFNDRPSEPLIREVETAPEGVVVYWIDPGAQDRANPEAAEPRLRELLHRQMGHGLTVLKAEPARDQAGNIQGFLVYAERN